MFGQTKFKLILLSLTTIQAGAKEAETAFELPIDRVPFLQDLIDNVIDILFVYLLVIDAIEQLLVSWGAANLHSASVLFHLSHLRIVIRVELVDCEKILCHMRQKLILVQPCEQQNGSGGNRGP